MKFINRIAWLFFLPLFVMAATPVTKTIDDILATGGSELAVPSSGSNLVSDTDTLTLTNKTLGNGSTWNGNAIGVTYGGTGTTTAPTQYGVIYASSTSAFASTAAGNAGDVLTSNGTSAPTFSTPVDTNNSLVAQYYFQNTSWTYTSSGSGNTSAFSAGGSQSPTLAFSGIIGSPQTTSTTTPQVTINSLPAGTYLVMVSATIQTSGTGNTFLMVNDGTNTSGIAGYTPNASGSNLQVPVTCTAMFNYSSTGNRTFSLWGQTGNTQTETLVVNAQNNQQLIFTIVQVSSPTTIGSSTGLVAQYYFGASGSGDYIWTTSSSTPQTLTNDGTAHSPVLVFSGNFGTPQTTSTTHPQVTINSLPAGTYQVQVIGTVYQNNGGNCLLQLSDGTSSQGLLNIENLNTGVGATFVINGIFQYSSSGNQTFSIQGSTNGSTTLSIDVTGKSAWLNWVITKVI